VAVKEVDEKRTGNVVRAVPECLVGYRPLGVLPEPEWASERLEM